MIEEYERRSYLSKGSYNSDSAGNPIPAAQGTFGWGGVNDEYPVQATGDGNEKNTNFYFTFNQTTKMFELHYSSNSPGQKDYRVIWRK